MSAPAKPRIRVRGNGRDARIVQGWQGISAAYEATNQMAGSVGAWQPPDGSAEALDGPARSDLRARARALVRNNGYADGAVKREIDAVIGPSFRPVPAPDATALGLEPAQQADLKKQIVSAWRQYADDPMFQADVGRRHTVSALFALAYRHLLLDGDAIAMIHQRETGPWRTQLRVVDPMLLDRPPEFAARPEVQSGIEIDDDGAPLAYHLRQGWPDQHDPASMRFQRVARYDAQGRPQVVHYFRRQRDGQVRGVSRLAPVIEAFHMARRYADAELSAAMLNAVLGLFVQSPHDESLVDTLSDGGKLSDYQTMRSAYADRNPVVMDQVRINRLFPGESVEVAGQRNLNNFKEFETAVLRRVAASFGQSYEQFAGDWSETNYSAMRAALLDVWRGWEADREQFARGFCTPIYLRWLEEAVERGRIVPPEGTPGVMAAPAAWTRAKWIGPGRGFVDAPKEQRASLERVMMGMSTLEAETGQLTGRDLDEVQADLAAEIAETPAGIIHPATRDWVEAFGRMPPDAAGDPDNTEGN